MSAVMLCLAAKSIIACVSFVPLVQLPPSNLLTLVLESIYIISKIQKVAASFGHVTIILLICCVDVSWMVFFNNTLNHSMFTCTFECSNSV